MIDDENKTFANQFQNGIATKKHLEKKGLYPKIIKGRLLRLDRNTLIEVPIDLQEYQEQAFIKQKKLEYNIK
jgi:hypothetical protein